VVVTHHLLIVGVEPVLGERRADGGGVAVDDLAEQQFGADRHHLDDHATTLASQSVPIGRVISAVTHSPGSPGRAPPHRRSRGVPLGPTDRESSST
jgi:hypothetical protein